MVRHTNAAFLLSCTLFTTPAAADAGSAACTPCHARIAEMYRRTPMAASSGEAGHGEPSATFIHTSSGYRYRIGRDAGTYWLEFEKIGDTAIRGKKPLAYFIG